MTEPQTPGSNPSPETQLQLITLVNRSQKVMAHAWMIRTFIKHSDEVEDFPELNEIRMARNVAALGAAEANRRAAPNPWDDLKVPDGLDVSTIGEDIFASMDANFSAREALTRSG